MLATLLPLLLIFTACSGPLIGSFFGLQVGRETEIFRRGKYGDRSECDHCGHKLAWYDLIPLVSYIMLRGKCRYCGKRISAKLFVAELMGLALYSILAVGIYYRIATDGIARDMFVNLIVHGSILTVLFYFAVYDLFTMSVPAVRTQAAAIYAVVVNAIFLIVHLINSNLLPQVELGTLGNLVMGVVAGGFIYAIMKFTRNEGMGAGDLLIAVIIGLALGWPLTVSAFYVMVFSASIVGLTLAAIKRKFHGLRVPLVPFMAFGYIVAITFGSQIFRLLFGAL